MHADDAPAPSHDHYLVIDLEATCDQGGRLPAREMEVIEIGAVLVDGATLQPVDEFQTFVRPVRHPTLTPFCTGLTSIAQSDVQDAPGFAEAVASLRAFLAGREGAQFCSWGAYDHKQLAQDAAFHRVELPFRGAHRNLKEQFSTRHGEPKRFGMDGALRRVGLELRGTHHRGIDDARNIARLLPWCLGRADAIAIALANRDVVPGPRRAVP